VIGKPADEPEEPPPTAVKPARTPRTRHAPAEESEESVKHTRAAVKRGARAAEEPEEPVKRGRAAVAKIVEKPPLVIESPPSALSTLPPKKAQPDPDEGSFWSDGDDDDDGGGNVNVKAVVAPKAALDDDEVVRPNPLVVGRARAVDLKGSIRSQAAALEEQKRERARAELPPPPPGAFEEEPTATPIAVTVVSAADEYGELESAAPAATPAEAPRATKVRRSRFRARAGKQAREDE
jgi:hypothetical protein